VSVSILISPGFGLNDYKFHGSTAGVSGVMGFDLGLAFITIPSAESVCDFAYVVERYILIANAPALIAPMMDFDQKRVCGAKRL
jgi:hypothetical protein